MKRAFTLVEILIVIAVIAILAALIFPVFGSVRDKSKQAVCLSNLSQIGKAVALYASDYDDRLPWAVSSTHKKAFASGQDVFMEPGFNTLGKTMPDLRSAVKPYGATEQVFICPLDHVSPLIAAQGGFQPTWYQDCGSSYSYDDHRVIGGGSLSTYPDPSEGILAADLEGFHSTYGPSGITDVLFADIHVKGITNSHYAELNAKNR